MCVCADVCVCAYVCVCVCVCVCVIPDDLSCKSISRPSPPNSILKGETSPARTQTRCDVLKLEHAGTTGNQLDFLRMQLCCNQTLKAQ